jgi:nucleoside-diphosphate-sugar epimerase
MNDGHLEYYLHKTVLVTGGAGAIGSNLVRALASAGAQSVIVLDDMSASHEWIIPTHPNVRFEKGDVADEVDLERVFDERPDVVFHLAAFFANQNSIDYPECDLQTNGLGTLRLLEHARLCGTGKVVYASSSSIYGAAAHLPVREEFASMHLTTPYQVTKKLGELYCNFFHHQYGLPIVNTRFFNSYGPGEVPGQYRNVIPNFIYWALNGEPLPITGTGEASRDFTYVGDLVNGLLRAGASELAVGGEFNLASASEVTIMDIAKMINELTENKAGIRPAQTRAWDTKIRLLASVDRARETFGYNPLMPIGEGLRITVDWFKANWDDIQESASFSPGRSDPTLLTAGLPAQA